MNAAISSSRVAGGRFGAPLVVLVFALGLALGAVLVLSINTLRSADDAAPAARVVAPKAYYVEGQGEGRLGGALPVAAPASRARINPNLGEGLRSHSAAQPVANIKAHYHVGMGEGWLSDSVSAPTNTLRAYYVPGQGEGWLGNGRPADAR